MEKTVEYYLNLPYMRELIPDPMGIWFVRIKELPGCISQGKTPEEAMHMIEDAMRGWITVSLEDGDQIPEPRPEEEYSGKFVMRLPKSLHRHLAERAEQDEVSLNTFCLAVLSEAVGKGSITKNAVKEERVITELPVVFGNLCKAAGLPVLKSSDCETAISEYFLLQIDRIKDFLEDGRWTDAIRTLAALEDKLRIHGSTSPFLVCMAELVAQMGNIIEGNEIKKESREKVSEIPKRDYINDLLSKKILYLLENVPETPKQKSSPVLKQPVIMDIAQLSELKKKGYGESDEKR